MLFGVLHEGVEQRLSRQGYRVDILVLGNNILSLANLGVPPNRERETQVMNIRAKTWLQQHLQHEFMCFNHTCNGFEPYVVEVLTRVQFAERWITETDMKENNLSLAAVWKMLEG